MDKKSSGGFKKNDPQTKEAARKGGQASHGSQGSSKDDNKSSKKS